MGNALFKPKVQLEGMLLTGIFLFQNTESKEINGIRDESNTFESKGKHPHYNLHLLYRKSHSIQVLLL